LDLLDKKVVAAMQHTRGPVTLVSRTANGDGGKSQIAWKFTDDEGTNWTGDALVEPANTQAGKFVVTLKLAREQLAKST
jgi:hypothetical protein